MDTRKITDEINDARYAANPSNRCYFCKTELWSRLVPVARERGLAVVVVALRSFRRRPLGNGLIVAGIAAAALGSGLSGLGAAGSAVGIAVGAVLLYAGFVAPARISALQRPRFAPR